MVNKQQLKVVLEKLDQYKASLQETDKKPLKKADFCIDVLEHFHDNYDEWITNCPLSNEIVSKFISDKYLKLDGIADEFYLSCARFLREYVFSLERKGIKNTWVSSDWSSFRDNAQALINPEHENWLNYLLNREFDIDVLNNYLGDRSYEAFLNYESNAKNAENNVKKFEEYIEEKKSEFHCFIEDKEKTVRVLADELKKQKTAFNFVGLSEGFGNLLSNKKSAKWLSFFILLAIGGSLCLVPYAYIRTIIDFSSETINEPYMWKLAIPFTGLEIILLYFFRVTLNHYNSLQTQIMQLELRQSLCQFIQSYADYAKEIKEKDGSSLEKFENLIFSSILSTPDKVPSTFDGLDQLANFVKEIKKG